MALKNAFENLAVESKQLPDNHQVTVSNQPTQPLTDTELRASAVDVTVSNPIADPATETTLDSVKTAVETATGTWGYAAGTSGTETLTGGKKVLLITAIALESAGSLTIDGGDTITIPYGSTDSVSSEFSMAPLGNLVDPEIIFTGTDAYFIQYVV